MSEYWKKSDVLAAMEKNSVMVNIFGSSRKMIDGMMLCSDLADLKTENISDDEESD